MKQVEDIKIACLRNPAERLWKGTTKIMSEVADIQKLVETLHYSSEPNYERIEDLLVGIFNNYTVHRSEL